MEDSTQKTNEVVETKKQNMFLSFILKHKFVFALLFVIIVMIIYHLILINSMVNKYDEKIKTLEREHVLQIDSIRIANLQQTIKVFSWAVRSEMNRNNLEEINNFFLTLIKEKGIRIINLVDPESARIILSTDKKNQGEQISDSQILNISSLKLLQREDKLFIVTPIMGLDRKSGILIVEIEH